MPGIQHSSFSPRALTINRDRDGHNPTSWYRKLYLSHKHTLRDRSRITHVGTFKINRRTSCHRRDDKKDPARHDGHNANLFLSKKPQCTGIPIYRRRTTYRFPKRHVLGQKLPRGCNALFIQRPNINVSNAWHLCFIFLQKKMFKKKNMAACITHLSFVPSYLNK